MGLLDKYKGKLGLKILCLMTGILGIGTVFLVSITFYRERASLLKQNEEKAELLSSSILQGIESIMMEGKADLAKTFVSDLKNIKGVEVLQILGKDGLEAFEPAGSKSPVSKTEETNFRKAIETGKEVTYREDNKTLTFFKPLINKDRCHGCHSPELNVLGAVKVSVSLKEISTEIKKNMIQLILISLTGILFLGIALQILLRRTVIEPIGRLAEITNKVSEGDLTQTLEIKSSDEIGGLAHAMNESISHMGDMVKGINDVSRQVGRVSSQVADDSKMLMESAQIQLGSIETITGSIEELNAAIRGIASSAEGLSSSAEQTSSSILEMAASVDEVANSTVELSSAVDGTSASIEEMRASVKEVAGSVEILSNASEETSSAVEEINATIKEVETASKESAKLADRVKEDASRLGMASIEKTIEGMKEIKEKVERTAEFINRLGKRSEEIGKILNVIDEVTEQTSLLALNAAILASQAGEHGKGFSVVADEIKELAERTAASTKEIGDLITSVQREARGAVEAMREGLIKVEEGVKLSKEAGEALRQILESSKSSSEMAISIERATVEQAKGVRQVAEAMDRIRDMVVHIARATSEQARGVEQIVLAAEKMRDVTQHVRAATSEQSKASKQIAQTVEIVTEKIQDIAQAIQEQKIGSDQIVNSIEGAKDLPRKNADIAFQISRRIDALTKATDLLKAEVGKFKTREVYVSEKILRMGVIPIESPAEMFRRFIPLSEYLSRIIGMKVDLKIALDFEGTIEDLGDGATQICYMTPTTYIEANHKYGVIPLVKDVLDGKPFTHSVIVVREGGKVVRIEDIKGRTFAFGDPKSTTSHLVPRNMLLEVGIDLEDLRLYRYLGHHDDVAKAVLKGDFDAGGMLESIAYKFVPQGLRIIKVSPDIPGFNISVTREMDPGLKERLKGVLLDINDQKAETRQVLKSINPRQTGFIEANDDDYSGIRGMMKKIKF
jgi:phosphate/phosphite/phosphonate ABC transporter binding protein